MRKPTSPEVGGRFAEICATSSSAFRPGIHRFAQCVEPSEAKTRFSPVRGTASAMVAIATTFMNDSRSLLCSVGVEAALHQSLRELEGHARAAELLVGIFATVLIRIHNRERFGHAIGTGQVMIGHDQIDAQTLRGFRGREGANAHVDADDQANARRRGTLDHVVAHVVAFTNAMRDVEVGRASAELDRGFQNDDGHGAVHVVVAVDEDGFFAFDGGVDAIDRCAEAGHTIWSVKMGERRGEKGAGRFRIGDAAAD